MTANEARAMALRRLGAPINEARVRLHNSARLRRRRMLLRERYGGDSTILGQRLQVGPRSLTIIGVAPDGFRATATRTPAAFIPITFVGYRDGAPRVMVVSEAMARALWPGQDPLGKCVRLRADTAPCTEVVGVAETVRARDFRDDPGLGYYLPIMQGDPDGGGLFVRVRGEAAAAAAGIRKRLQRSMPGISYVTGTPMSNLLGPPRRSWRLGATRFSLFGVLALVIAAVGLYSVIAYNVALRRHELGVRMALGAGTGDIVRLVLGQGVRVGIAGIAIGVAISWWAARWIAPLLLRQSPHDPVVFVTVSVVLLLVAVLASLTPAIRATRVDPTSALRSE